MDDLVEFKSPLSHFGVYYTAYAIDMKDILSLQYHCHVILHISCIEINVENIYK